MLCARITLTLLLITVPLQSLRAQTAAPPALPSWTDTLARPAGMIFSGTVIRIERAARQSRETQLVRVTFHVDDAVRGCATGDTVEMWEWAGLWTRADRYRPGEKLLLFLYARNGEGLTSPVAGDLGVLRLSSRGVLQLTSAQAALFGQVHPAPYSPVRPAHPSVSSSATISKDDVIARIREAQ
jgi:hypothetical protein